MIEVSMTSPTGVTMAAGGTYVPENVRVTPAFAFAENAKRWEIELVGSTSGSEGVLLQDQWLADHYSDANLCFVLIKTSDEEGVYGNTASNSRGMITKEYRSRLLGDAQNVYNDHPFNTTENVQAGFVRLLSDGRVQYINGNTVSFEDGTYMAMAWLA